MYIQYSDKEWLVTLNPLDPKITSKLKTNSRQVMWRGVIDANSNIVSVVGFIEENGLVYKIDHIADGVQTPEAVIIERINDFLRSYRQTELFGFENTETNNEADPVPYNPDDITIRRDTYSVFQIFKMIEDGDINLSPDFQRNLVWDNIRKSRLIESILLGIPLPVFYFAENRDGTFNVVDGLQRLSTIRQYLRNEFYLRNLEYLKVDCESKYFRVDEEKKIKTERVIERKYARRIEQAQLGVNIIEAKSPNKVKYDIFKRINEGGRPLNSQEIRNSMATNETRLYLREMAQSKAFLNATGGSVNDTRMDAQELVLRFTAFYLQKQQMINYVGSMNTFLDDTLEMLNSQKIRDFDELRQKFIMAMENSYWLFGKYCFRKCLTINLRPGSSKQLLNRSLFTTWSIELCEKDFKEISQRFLFESFAQVLAKELDDEGEYYDVLTTRTTDKKSLEIAFWYTRKLLNDKLIF